jgi:hypothetical protein
VNFKLINHSIHFIGLFLETVVAIYVVCGRMNSNTFCGLWLLSIDLENNSNILVFNEIEYYVNECVVTVVIFHYRYFYIIGYTGWPLVL